MQNFLQTVNWSLVIFIVIQFANVIISTIKSVLTVKGGKTTAAIINAVSYTFAAVVTKFITEQSFLWVILITFFTNLIGVYLAKWLLEKTKKERLWTIMTTAREDNHAEIEQQLRRRDIQYTLLPAANDRYFIHIFSYSKAESAMISEILEQFSLKYSIVENRSSF